MRELSAIVNRCCLTVSPQHQLYSQDQHNLKLPVPLCIMMTLNQPIEVDGNGIGFFRIHLRYSLGRISDLLDARAYLIKLKLKFLIHKSA